MKRVNWTIDQNTASGIESLKEELGIASASGVVRFLVAKASKSYRETESGLAKRLAPTVLSKIDPPSEWLIRARGVIREIPELQEFFRRAREESRSVEWLANNLAVRLSGVWGSEHFGEAQQVSQYLADEFFQLGEGIQVFSTTTGKVEAILSEGDLYTPDPVLREDGSLASPLPRIRPELEANLITWAVEREREAKILQSLATRATQTDLQREEGDSRLLVATRKGRSSIVQALTNESPKALLGACGGTSAAFLHHFEIEEATFDPEEECRVATARSKMGIQDPTALNLQYNRAAALRQILPQGWVRSIAFQISEEAKKAKRVWRVQAEELEVSDLSDFPFWVAPPEAIPAVQLLLPRARFLPVEGSCLIGFPERVVGLLTVSDSFSSASHEMSDKWEVVGNLPYNVKVDLCHLRTLTISGIGVEGHLVENGS